MPRSLEETREEDKDALCRKALTRRRNHNPPRYTKLRLPTKAVKTGGSMLLTLLCDLAGTSYPLTSGIDPVPGICQSSFILLLGRGAETDI